MKTNILGYKKYSPRKWNITRGNKIFSAEMKCKNIPPDPKIFVAVKIYSPRQKIFPAAEKLFPAAKLFPLAQKIFPAENYSPRPRNYSPRPRKYSPRKKYSPRPRKYSPRKKIFPAAQKIFPAEKKYYFLCPSQASVDSSLVCVPNFMKPLLFTQ